MYVRQQASFLFGVHLMPTNLQYTGVTHICPHVTVSESLLKDSYTRKLCTSEGLALCISADSVLKCTWTFEYLLPYDIHVRNHSSSLM